MKSRLCTFAAALVPMLLMTVAAQAARHGFPGGIKDALGPAFEPQSSSQSLRSRRFHGADPMSRLRHWNAVAIDASGLDHTPVVGTETRIFGEQLGPGRSSRAMAIVHIAVFEAVNAIAGGFTSYVGLEPPDRNASLSAAIAQAAHDTLAALYPSQREDFADQLAADLGRAPHGSAKAAGIAAGAQAAAAILSARVGDGADHPEPRVGIEWTMTGEAGHWAQDPISMIPLALGAHWGVVTPFVIRSATDFRVPPPPALDSDAYADAFQEVKRLGGDGLATPTERTDEETLVGIYWAYDGTPSLCAPPRLYNQIAVHIAEQMGTRVIDLARLLALVNVAMADAGIAIWESKFHYDVWRPVTGIRAAENDGNPDTTADPTFRPLGAPASNLSGPNFTPPFPAYPSGHAGFGGAVFQVLRRFYGTDAISFTFVSDEFNGSTVGSDGVARPLLPRRFESLSQAEEENGQSRIFLGIHWSFDKTAGIEQGNRIADYVVDHLFTATATN